MALFALPVARLSDNLGAVGRRADVWLLLMQHEVARLQEPLPGRLLATPTRHDRAEDERARGYDWDTKPVWVVGFERTEGPT